MENLSRRTTINIVVRSNISKRNMEHYGELYSYLVDFNKKYGTNLTLYPARMEVYHNSKTGKDEKLSQEEFLNILEKGAFYPPKRLMMLSLYLAQRNVSTRMLLMKKVMFIDAGMMLGMN